MYSEPATYPSTFPSTFLHSVEQLALTMQGKSSLKISILFLVSTGFSSVILTVLKEKGHEFVAISLLQDVV